MAAADDLDVRVQRVESKIDALGGSVDQMSADHRDHTDFAVERLGAELRGRLDAVDARFDAVDRRFDRMDARFDAVEGRVDSVDARCGTLLGRFDGSDARLERMHVRFTRLERKVDRILEHLLPGAPPDTKRHR